MADENPHPYDGYDVECRRDPDTGGTYFIALAQDPKVKVVTLVGFNGEPGKAVKRSDWESWELVKAT